MIRLRLPQQQCITAIMDTLRRVWSALVVMPTGTGKTVVISQVVKMATKGRVLVLAHREELISQLAGTIQAQGVEVGIEMAEHYAQERYWDKPQVVVATVQTLTASDARRLKALVDDPDEWTLTIFDEAHHAPAASWRQIADHMLRNDKHKVLGFTATPDRADEMAMGSVFEEVAFNYEILDAMHDGYLVPPKVKYVAVESLDYEHVRTRAGDLAGSELAKVMEDERNVQGMAVPMYQEATGPWNVVFCATVAQAEDIAMVLNRLEPDCARVVHANTEKSERRRIFQEFDSGDIKFLVNVAICTEGWDCPNVRMVVLASPTKSRAKYVQMVGRGLRPLPGLVDHSSSTSDSAEARRAAIAASDKSSCVILDFAGNCGKHKLTSMADILGGKWPEEVRARADELLKEGEYEDVEEALEEADEQLRAEAERAKRDAIAKKQKLRAKVDYSTRSYDPFDLLDIDPMRDPNEENASEAQIDFLRKFGVDATEMSKRQANKFQRDIYRRKSNSLCTLKQARWLKMFGYTGEETFDEAKAILDREFAKKGRRR